MGILQEDVVNKIRRRKKRANNIKSKSSFDLGELQRRQTDGYYDNSRLPI
jgi:hypothetical protein